MNVPARGVLAKLYEGGDANARALLTQGWVKLPREQTKIEPAPLVAKFDEALAAGGFAGRFANPKTIDKAGTAPMLSWGLDPTYLPYSDAAMDARLALRRVTAEMLQMEETALASSFDACIATHAKFSNKPYFDSDVPRVPCSVDKKDPTKPGGPAHVDQAIGLTDAADSFQALLALSPTGPKEMSTCLLAPIEPYTIQGIMDAARQALPHCFRQELQINGGDDGYKVMPEVQEYLIKQRMARAIKPRMEPGDVLIWTSAMVHCAGAAKTAPKETRRPRLAVIASFHPKAMMSEAANTKRRKIVGGKKATGQKVHRPNPHMPWPGGLRYVHPDAWPPVYKALRAERQGLAGSKRSFCDADEADSEEQKDYKRKVRCLLG